MDKLPVDYIFNLHNFFLKAQLPYQIYKSLFV